MENNEWWVDWAVGRDGHIYKPGGKMPKAASWYVIQEKVQPDSWNDLNVGWLSFRFGNRRKQIYKTYKAAEANAINYHDWKKRNGREQAIRLVERLGSNDYVVAEV